MSRRAADNLAPENVDPHSEQGAPATAARAKDRLAIGFRWLLVALSIVALGAIYSDPLEHLLRCTVANRYAKVACARVQQGERQAALEAVDQALAWLPGDAALIYLRAQIHATGKNWEASLADFSEVTNRLAPNFAAAYVRRAEVHRMAANFRQAADDLGRAIELSPRPDPDLLNERAYMRALADTDLEIALVEVEEALELLDQMDDADNLKLHREAVYLDTRGYIRFRMKKYEAALGDIERALRVLHVDRDRMLKRYTKAKMSPGEVMRAYDQVQAEIVYHRGEVRQALGEDRLAEDDFSLAHDLGYVPPDAG